MLPDTWYPAGYTAKNKFYLYDKKEGFSFSFFFLFFPLIFSFFNKTIVVIAHNIYNLLFTATGYPVSGQPDIWWIKPDIRPDTEKGRISGGPDIRYNPSKFPSLFVQSKSKRVDQFA